MRFKLTFLSLVIILFVCSSSSLIAGGGSIQAKNRWLFIPGYHNVYATRFANYSGKSAEFTYHGAYQNHFVKLYVEYGLTKRTTLVSNIPFLFTTYLNDLYKVGRVTFSDWELGFRYGIRKNKLAFQGLLILPFYKNDAQLRSGQGNFGIDARIAGTIGNRKKKIGGYLNLDGGLRVFSNGKAQLPVQVTYGYTLAKRKQVNLDLMFMQALGKDFDLNETNANASLGSSYMRITGAYAFLVGRSTHVQLGAYQDIYNSNSMISRGIFLNFVTNVNGFRFSSVKF